MNERQRVRIGEVGTIHLASERFRENLGARIDIEMRDRIVIEPFDTRHVVFVVLPRPLDTRLFMLQRKRQ